MYLGEEECKCYIAWWRRRVNVASRTAVVCYRIYLLIGLSGLEACFFLSAGTWPVGWKMLNIYFKNINLLMGKMCGSSDSEVIISHLMIDCLRIYFRLRSAQPPLCFDWHQRGGFQTEINMNCLTALFSSNKAGSSSRKWESWAVNECSDIPSRDIVLI